MAKEKAKPPKVVKVRNVRHHLPNLKPEPDDQCIQDHEGTYFFEEAAIEHDNEVLLAVVIDRMLQELDGDKLCKDHKNALSCIQSGLNFLHSRTRELIVQESRA